MRLLPLYPKPPFAAIELEECLEVDPGCTRCDLRESVRHVCLGGEGEPGGVLLVGESPGRNEDQVGRPFIGASGQLLRKLLARHWRGPVAIDNAIRCAPGAREVKDKHAEACRGYLAETIAESKPQRIISLGGWSAYSLTGRSVAPFSTRRGYTHLVGGRFGPRPIPLFFVVHPAAALRNRFVNAWFEEDFAWALTVEASALRQLPSPETGLVRVVSDGPSARHAVAELRAAEWSAFDVETAGVVYDKSFRLLCVSFCAKGSESPWSWDIAALADPEAREELCRFLVDPKARKLGQNVKFDEIACHLTLGVKPRGVRGDVRLLRKLLEPEADGKLDKMSELVGMGGIKEEAREEMSLYVDKIKRGLHTERRLAKNAAEDTDKLARGETVKRRAKLRADMAEALDYLHQIDVDYADLAPVIRDPEADWESWAYAIVPTDMLLRYNGRDSVATARLAEWLEPQVEAEPALARVRAKLVEPAAQAIRSVERWGVPADRGAIMAFDSYLGVKLAEVRARLAAYGESFNPDSPPQVSKLLFETLRLKPLRTTPSGGYSTDDETLESLKDKHPAAGAIADHRTYSKLKGTYADGLLHHLRPDGRIHTSILLDGARSGRTSSSKPNLQNIPRAESIEGKMARDCFAASPGFTLLQLDYSQLELRVAAMLSGDEKMISIFREGVDYHKRTAELISKIAWGIDPSQVEKKHRSQSKSVNFGILYGKTASTLAKEWGVSTAKAQAVVDAIMGQFRRLDAWCQEKRSETRRSGLSWTWWDGEKARRRPLWRIADSDDLARSTAENGAVNTPIQGTASDFCIASLIEAVQWIEGEGLEPICRLILPVHDSLMFEVRRDFVEEAAKTVHEIMMSWNSGGVPLEVDVEVGDRWGSLEKLKLAA